MTTSISKILRRSSTDARAYRRPDLISGRRLVDRLGGEKSCVFRLVARHRPIAQMIIELYLRENTKQMDTNHRSQLRSSFALVDWAIWSKPMNLHALSSTKRRPVVDQALGDGPRRRRRTPNAGNNKKAINQHANTRTGIRRTTQCDCQPINVCDCWFSRARSRGKALQSRRLYLHICRRCSLRSERP